MTGFNFLFEAFVLLMGLAMAQVLQGFASVLKLRARRRAGIEHGAQVRIGWLVPMLGLTVILDQSTFFLHMYGIREVMPLNVGTMIGVLLAIGWYYLVSSLTFPDEPELWPDFDAWYWQQKRFILAGVIGVNLISIASSYALVTAEMQKQLATSMTPALALASLFAMTALPAMIALYFLRGYRANLVLLGYLIVNPVIYGLVVIGGEQPF